MFLPFVSIVLDLGLAVCFRCPLWVLLWLLPRRKRLNRF
jgi:flagellar biosynthesis component FlhA